jgi:cytochrome P450
VDLGEVAAVLGCVHGHERELGDGRFEPSLTQHRSAHPVVRLEARDRVLAQELDAIGYLAEHGTELLDDLADAHVGEVRTIVWSGWTGGVVDGVEHGAARPGAPREIEGERNGTEVVVGHAERPGGGDLGGGRVTVAHRGGGHEEDRLVACRELAVASDDGVEECQGALELGVDGGDARPHVEAIRVDAPSASHGVSVGPSPVSTQTTIWLIMSRIARASGGRPRGGTMATGALGLRFEALLGGGPGDPTDTYRALRDEPPVWSDAFNGWVVSRYHDVRTVLTDEAHFAPLGYGAGSSIIHGRTILHMEGEEHRKKGAVLARQLRNTRLLEGPQREYVRAASARYADALPIGRAVDVKERFTTPLPLDVTAWLMDIAQAPDFRTTYDTIVAAGASNLRGDPDVQRRGEEARAQLFAFVTPLIAQRRADPGDDLLSTLCSTEYEGVRLSDDEIRSFCSFLLAAGVETTDRALSSLLNLLWQRPDVWTELRSRRDLLKSVAAEGLRFAPPVHALSRGVLDDVELSGRAIARGERVVAIMASANRDPAVFADPDRFDPERFAENPDREFGARAQILSFGYGTHLCTGSQLAKLEILEALDVLLDRVAAVEFADGVPDDHGYVLRSPEHLRVVLRGDAS